MSNKASKLTPALVRGHIAYWTIGDALTHSKHSPKGQLKDFKFFRMGSFPAKHSHRSKSNACSIERLCEQYRTGVRVTSKLRVGTAAHKEHIANRDNWMCGICRNPIDRRLSIFTSKWAAVVDHIQPRARGGGHNEQNLQIAHYECNRRKAQWPQYSAVGTIVGDW